MISPEIVYSELFTTQRLDNGSTHYNIWKSKILFIFANKGIDYVLHQPQPPEKRHTHDLHHKWRRDDAMCKYLILEAVKDNAFFSYRNNDTAKSMMDYLEQTFNLNPPPIGHRMYVFHRYLNRRMTEGMSISKHVFEIRAAAYELELAGVRVPDEMQAVVLMNSLPGSWDDVAYLLNLQLGTGVGKENELGFLNVSQRLKVAAHMGPPRRTRDGGNNAGFRYNQSNCPEDQHAKQDCNSDSNIPLVEEMDLYEKRYHKIKTSGRLNYTGANFSEWKFGLSVVFDGLGLGYNLRHPKPSKPTDSSPEHDVNSYNKWLADDFTCRHLILGAMEDNLMVTFQNQPTAKALVNELNAWFDFSSLGERMSLFRQYVECVMSDDTEIDDHISNMETMVYELKRAGIDVPDEIEAVVLLNSLPCSWEDMTIGMNVRIDEETKEGMKLLDSAVKSVKIIGHLRASKRYRRRY